MDVEGGIGESEVDVDGKAGRAGGGETEAALSGHQNEAPFLFSLVAHLDRPVVPSSLLSWTLERRRRRDSRRVLASGVSWQRE